MINLLPPKQKEELKEEEILSLILILGTVILAFLVSFSLILFAIKTFFNTDLKEQQAYIDQREKELNDSVFQELEQKIKDYNLIFSQLEDFYTSQPDLKLTFEKIFQFFPENIYLTGLSFTPQTSQVSLSGLSLTSETLNRLEKNLKDTKGIKEVILGPEYWWLKTADINFTLDFKIEK